MATLTEIEQLEFELGQLSKIQESLQSRLDFLKTKKAKVILRKSRLRKKVAV